jgi:hypothetical protein
MSEQPQEDVLEAAGLLAALQEGRDKAAEAERRADLEYVGARLVEAIADAIAEHNHSRQVDAIFATDEAKERRPKVSSGNGQAKGQAAPPELHIISVASLAGKPVPPREWFVPDVIIGNRVTILSGNWRRRKISTGRTARRRDRHGDRLDWLSAQARRSHLCFGRG